MNRHLIYWPICALFGHEALGLMSSTLRCNYRDTIFCACGCREHTYQWYVTQKAARRV